MPLIMANSKDDLNHKGKYFDTSRKIYSQEKTICIVEALFFIFLEVMTNAILHFYAKYQSFSTQYLNVSRRLQFRTDLQNVRKTE